MPDNAVFRKYSFEELREQYDNRRNVPNHQELYDSWKPLNEAFLADCANHLDVAYGAAERQKLDIYVPAGDGPFPVQVFFHGGYWFSRSKSDAAFIGHELVKSGILWVSVGYTLIPACDMDELLRQCGEAMIWLYANIAEYGGDPGNLNVSGHSAGGHIAAMMVARDWTACGLPMELVKHCTAVSGIYDLEPIRLGHMRETLGLTGNQIMDCSPARLAPHGGAPVLVSVGGHETAEFKRQSNDLARKWSALGANTHFMQINGRDHFTVLEDYAKGRLKNAMLNALLGTDA